MSDSAEVHNFLNVRGAEHRVTRLTAGVDVRMVAEDVECVARDAAGGNVYDVRNELAGDLVHVRDHEKKTLGSSVGRGQSTG